MYVRPSFRGRGIARQLIVAVEEDALAAGRPVIRLETGRMLAAPIALCVGLSELTAKSLPARFAVRLRAARRRVAS